VVSLEPFCLINRPPIRIYSILLHTADTKTVIAQPDIVKKLDFPTINLSGIPFQDRLRDLPPTPKPVFDHKLPPDHQLTRGTKHVAPVKTDLPGVSHSKKRLASISLTTVTHNAFVAKPETVAEEPYAPTPFVNLIRRSSVHRLNPKHEDVNEPHKIYQDKLCPLALRLLARELICQMN